MITDIVNHLKDMLELPDEEIPEFIRAEEGPAPARIPQPFLELVRRQQTAEDISAVGRKIIFRHAPQVPAISIRIKYHPRQ